MQNPETMRKFEDVARWLRETSGAHLEGVSLDDFRERIRAAVAEMKEPAGVLPKVKSRVIDVFHRVFRDLPHAFFLEERGRKSSMFGS